MSLPPWISGHKTGNSTGDASRGFSSGTSKVRNPKKPKSRPPKSLRETILLPVRTLPAYSGPYSVGTMEIEVPVDEPRYFSEITRNGHHLLKLKTVLLTIYYPASPPTDKKRPSRQLWLGRPRLGISQGFGHFSTVGPLVLPVFLPTMFTKLPAFRNAPLSSQFPANAKPEEGEGTGTETETGAKGDGARAKGTAEAPEFPLMVFSHGLGGTKTAYSSVCGEFASYGFVVLAVEHRDGSGPRTYVNKPKGEKVDTEDGDTNKKQENLKYGDTLYDYIDYIFPKDNAWDTSPQNEKGVDHDLRNAQLDLRMAEIEEAYKVICKINEGKGEDLASKNLRQKGYKASSSYGLTGMDWSSWKGRVQTENAVAAGHSFGGATVTDMLRHKKRFDWVAQGIIYDIWGAGTREPTNTDDRIQAPIIAINSEAFTYWPSNFELVKSLIKEAHPSPAWLMTVKGTIHVSQSDFSLLYPNICSFFLKATADPERALDINVNASLEFLGMVMPGIPERIQRAFPTENLLQEQTHTLEQIPSIELHKPKDDKWIAARLQIPHEFTWRVFPKLARKMARRKASTDGGDQSEGEIWLHYRPEEDRIESHAARVKARRSQDAPNAPGSVGPNPDQTKSEEIRDWAS